MTVEKFYQVYGLPTYCGTGRILDVYHSGLSSRELCIMGTCAKDCDKYLDALPGRGFDQKEERSVCKNRYLWFESKTSSLYVSYMPDIQSLRVVASTEYPQSRPSPKPLQSTTEPFLAQIGIKLGMCYCIRLIDGTFLMIDGGYRNEEDTDMLYRFLKDHSPNTDKPVIRAWFASHTHPDHIRLAEDFIQAYSEKTELWEVVYNFPDFLNVNLLKESPEGNQKAADQFIRTVRDHFPNACHTVCHTGQVFSYPGVRVTTIMTHEDCYPIPLVSSNHTSSAWRFDFDGGKSFMCLADIWTEMADQMAKTFSADYLKADIMQVIHHGLLGGSLALYQAIDPDICLWPSPEDRFLGTYVDPKRVAAGKPTIQYCIGEGGCDFNAWLRNNEIRKRKHYHAGNTICIAL